MKYLSENIKLILRGARLAYKIEKNYMISILLYALFSPLLAFVNIWLFSAIINRLNSDISFINAVKMVSAILVLELLLYTISRILLHYKDFYHAVFMKSEDMMFAEKTMRMKYTDVENSEVYYLRQKIKGQNQNGYNMYYLTAYLQKCISGLLAVFSSLAMLTPILSANVYKSWILPGMMLFIFISVAVSIWCNKKINGINLSMYRQLAPHNVRSGFYADYYDDHNACKDIKLYGMADLLLQEQLKENCECNEIMLKARKRIAGYACFDSTMCQAFIAVAYLIVVVICISDEISIGDIVKLIGILTQILTAVTALITGTQSLFDNNKYLKDYFSFLDLPDEVTERTGQIEFNGNIAVHAEHVSFRYPKTEKYVLKDVSFDIPAHKKVAIVGENGSGKSTLVKLLCGLYDLQEGTITVNGIRVDSKNIMDLRAETGTVFQDSELLAFSVGENVAVSRNYDATRLSEALSKAGMYERVSEMPDQYKTILFHDFDEDGIELSGGEEQKLTIARAFYKQSKLLLFDEPTASLDPLAESEIYSKIESEMGDNTVIFVSHRLSSCRFCDLIIVLDRGKVAQIGSHEQLLNAPDSHYAKLWNAQADMYKPQKSNIA